MYKGNDMCIADKRIQKEYKPVAALRDADDTFWIVPQDSTRNALTIVSQQQPIRVFARVGGVERLIFRLARFDSNPMLGGTYFDETAELLTDAYGQVLTGDLRIDNGSNDPLYAPISYVADKTIDNAVMELPV